jgi:hypothetical protein
MPLRLRLPGKRTRWRAACPPPHQEEFMADSSAATLPSIPRLILIPGLITLAVTIIRLMGELRHLSPVLFNSQAGGAGALVGIAWLAPIFGIYFGLKLERSGAGPQRPGKALGLAILGLIVMAAGLFVAVAPVLRFPGKQLVGYLLTAAGGGIILPAWPSMFRVLLAYGYAARIPVVIIMFLALRGHWGTHYDAIPPFYHGPLDLWPLYFRIAVLPQMISWIAFTLTTGTIFGAIVAWAARREKAA